VKLKVASSETIAIYFDSLAVRNLWTQTIMAIIGSKNVVDSYKFGQIIGKGQFGLVYKGTHKLSGQTVSIKQVSKKTMSPLEMFQQKREIEVLKMCQHSSIIQ